MKVFVLNCGSSSVKYQLVDTDLEKMEKQQEIVLARGSVEKIGLVPSISSYQVVQENPLFLPQRQSKLPPPEKEPVEVVDHIAAIRHAIKCLTNEKTGVMRDAGEIQAVGHRMVHGGEKFKKSQVINDEVLRNIRECVEFAPLHNPHNLRGYNATYELFPNIPQVAVFDTAFHQTMPPHAYLYGLPYAIYQKHGIRRYGFHGSSHRYVTYRLGQLCGVNRDQLRVITIHLGNGCSMTAVDHGKSIDTTMGFTPLEGLLMGTRTGDLDASVPLTLMAKEEISVAEVNAMMNKHSGLYGISGVSNDMREVIMAAQEKKQDRAQIAIDMFCYRIKKYVGAYAAAMGGLDHVIFTGGIGENSPLIRDLSMKNLEFLGIEVDPQLNKMENTVEGKISTGNVGVWVVPTNEELVIARDTIRAIEGVDFS
ncbi:MAG TPA: acetate kinase [bacterium]|nr:acetate kinase [bacterium]HQP98755.1 acetate kinase [bacterium]